jgi:Xaa-Pro aminopeptidase
VLEALDGGLAVFRAPRLAVHANDVEHRYRPESTFHYLTGFGEPDAVAVLDGSGERNSFVLFVQPRDPTKETWTGPRAGVEGACEVFGADAAFPMDQLSNELIPRIARARELYYRLGLDESFDVRMLDMARAAWAARPRTSNDLPASVRDPGPVVHELRLKKSEAEIAWMRHAIAIATEGHLAAIREVRPGMREFEIEALVEYTFRRGGASGFAYPTIAAGGANATILHYTANQDVLRDGELLLLDAGCEVGCYCSDITRTFPIGDRFTTAQERIYDLVLQSQLAAIAAVKPGASVEDPHNRAVEVLVDGLLSLGVLKGSAKAVIDEGLHRPYFMHRTSHWLGMDVHDVGAYKKDEKARVLEPGMILTVEPGLYFSRGADSPSEYRGIGVRIEDDVLVTPGGHEVLSVTVPKRSEELLGSPARSSSPRR